MDFFTFRNYFLNMAFNFKCGNYFKMLNFLLKNGNYF